MEKRARKLVIASRLFSFLISNALVAIMAAGAFAQAPATLTGVVHDSAGKPIADAEVILRDANRATRTNDRGQFTIPAPSAGSYGVWFRRLGYRSVDYTWRALAGERTEISAGLFPIPRPLDPVVVRADEDKRSASRASILGLVLDTAGAVIPEAEVQVVGADMSGTARANGGFLFKPLAVGTYVLRVRKLGFEPAMVTVQLSKGDDHEVIVYLRPLAANLDPFVINDRSGYGRDQVIYDELEKRKRWQSFQTRLLGPDDLKSYYNRSLDDALIKMGLYRSPYESPSGRPTSINGPLSRGSTMDPRHDDACILLNGKDPVVRPLTSFTTDEIEMLEVYPPRTELSGTVGWRFYQPACKPIGVLDHPMYFVVWLKKK
jgi:hypothetical protein